LNSKRNAEIGSIFDINAVSLSLKRAEDAIEDSNEIKHEFEELKDRCLN